MKLSRLLMVGFLVVVLGGAGWIGWQKFGVGSSAAPAASDVSTVTVRRGSVVASVSASGNISAPKTSALAFASSGRVAKVNVQTGDVVKKNQVLVELDPTDLTMSLKSAQVALTNAQASYDQTKADLQFALRTSQGNLDSSKASLENAKAEYAQNPNTLIVAKLALDQAKVTLQSAQSDYDKVAWRGDVGMTTQAATLQSATNAYRSALASYNKTAATINDSALKQAEAGYSNAQVSLEQAQKNMDTKMASAQATLDSAKLSVDQAQRNLDNAKLVAPFDGIVSAVNCGVGDTASGTAVTIVDSSQLQVKVTVAEVDIAKIKVGETSAMTLDALAGKNYSARVIAVSPVGTVTSGVVNYSVTLEIANADGSIKPGMTATLNIEVERRDNVLLIPTRAIKTLGNQKMVTVQAQGQTTQKAVTIGLSNDSMVEVTNGLQEGDVLLVNQTTTSTSKSTNATGGVGIPGLTGGGGPSGGPPPGGP